MADDNSNGRNTPPSSPVKDVHTVENSKDMDSKLSDVLFPDDSDDDGDIFKVEKKRTDSMLVATSGDFEVPLEKDNFLSFSRMSDKNGGEKKIVDDEEDVEKTFLSFKEQNFGKAEAAAVLGTTNVEKSRKKSSEICLDEADLIEIIVSDAKKVGDGMNAYVAYKVSTKTNSKLFVRQELNVSRRFSDFLGLYEQLVQKHQHLGRIIPCPPEKDMFGMTRIKITKEETGSMDFVERRRAALERFLMKIARHPQLSKDESFVEFLQVEGELPKVSGVSFLSGAGIAKLFGRVGESINKMTYTLPESDQFFEDKNEQLEILDRCLQDLHTSSEALVLQRKDLGQCTNMISKAVANLGSTEEDLPLSRTLSGLSDNFGKMEKVHQDQADLDYFSFSELFKDHLQMLGAIGAVMNERVKAHKQWKDAEAFLQKKRDQKTKLEAQKKTDKLEFVSIEISEAEEKVAEGEKKFEEVSATIKKELGMLEKMMTKEYKNTFINYLQGMANLQAEVRDIWQSVLSDVELSKN